MPLLLAQAYDLAARWAAAGSDESKLAEFSAKDIASFGTSQRIVFLEKVETLAIPAVAVRKLDDVYQLSHAGNAETSLRFFEIALASGKEYAPQASVWVQDSEWILALGLSDFMRSVTDDRH